MKIAEKLVKELLKEWILRLKSKETHPNAKSHEKKTLLANNVWENRNRRNGQLLFGET
jgi:hypothetical protein